MVRVIALDDARELDLPGRKSREVVGAAAGAVSATVRYVEIAPAQPGNLRGPHVHSGFEECIHVLSGTGTMKTDEGEHPVSAGDTIVVASGERHATYNRGETVLTLLCFFPTCDVASGTVEYESW